MVTISWSTKGSMWKSFPASGRSTFYAGSAAEVVEVASAPVASVVGASAWSSAVAASPVAAGSSVAAGSGSCFLALCLRSFFCLWLVS